jgi:hypothetical protein
MTGLVKPKLGTDKKTGWKFYYLHLSSSYILKEFLLVSNYKKCIKNSISLQLGEVSNWALEMDQQNFHEVYVHSFIGMWSSFEAGLINIVADFIANDIEIAKNLSEKFKPGRFDIDNWPWNEETCLDLSQRIESKAKNETPNGGVNFFNRVQTIFSWLDIKIEIHDQEKQYLDEANRVRNILLHRYGEVSEKDAREISTLAPWVGTVMPLTHETFSNYYNGISKTLVGIMQGIAKKI